VKARTLIAGCGVRRHPGGVVALDRDRGVLARYARINPRALRVCADIRHLPFRPGVFDAVDFWNVLEHVEEKEPLVAELSRVSRPGARMTFSAGLRRCDRVLGRISRTYRRLVTDGYHVHSASARTYLDLLSRHFRIVGVRYPSSAYVFLVEGLVDFYGVTISESGEYLGPNGGKVLGLARRWTPFFQPLFGRLARLFREDLSQTIEVEAMRP
jgi:SAM-dependent methyltransferase